MTYFTKYCFVDGELEVGDTVLDAFNNPFKLTKYNNQLVFMDDCTYYKFPDKRFKKAKLFFCTNDIQVGDSIYLTDDEGEQRTGTVLRYRPSVRFPDRMQFVVELKHPDDTEAFFVDEAHPFKIIKEVPESLSWVKANMKFKELPV